MTIGQAPQCLICKHFNEEEKTKFACKAFPQGIPMDIVRGFDHRKPYPGDKGIRFEEKEKAGKG